MGLTDQPDGPADDGTDDWLDTLPDLPFEGEYAYIATLTSQTSTPRYGTGDTDPWLEALHQRRPTVAELPAAVSWLRTHHPTTSRAYEIDLASWLDHLHYLGVAPNSALPAHTQLFVSAMTRQGLSPATQQRRLAAVTGWYAWGRRNGLTTADPSLTRKETPKVHHDATGRLGLSRDETRRIMDEAQHSGQRNAQRTHALLMLLTVCGLRISEALGADVTDLHTRRGRRTLTVIGKGNRPRTVVLPDVVATAVDDYLATRPLDPANPQCRLTGPLLITFRGKRIDRTAAWKELHRLGERTGITLHPHLLRHTAATAALDAGAPLDRVQAMLGHADPKTTMVYARARDRIDNSATDAVAEWLNG